MSLAPRRLTVFVGTWALWCLPSTAAYAQCANPTAQIVRIANRVEHKGASANVFAPATLNLNVCQGDSIRAGERSRATVAFLDKRVVLTIEQNTEWVVRRPSEPSRSLIDLVRGAILFFTRQPLDIQTPFVNATVEGTEFLVRVEDDRTLITVFEGQVRAVNDGGSLTLTSNQSAVAQKGQAPQLQVVVRPRDAVQWALYYQPLLPDDSLAQLEQIPDPQRNARFYVRRAAVLLKVGRLDEARTDIRQALDRDPNDGDAYALRSVIAVALNDRTEALASGREAVNRSPTSPASRVALSYALQAGFELEAARDEVLRAVADPPGDADANAWARLAELHQSLGYLDRAQEAANRAASLAPDLARANTVLGFAALARVDISRARSAFERAIERESDSPLARLGLGLAKIRSGDLHGGRRDLEIAAALSPGDAIARSYLGKAYFEEKREPLPSAQFEQAKQLDPNDPTPWFYDAIRKQTLNRPVEALQDLEKSIDLNDNRAVYRSRLLLDQDRAARSASLGRIYRDLGFEQLALVEGFKSVNTDGADYSGHRFLADTYSALPRHEAARVSELLQSQLLQPTNITPIQPQLAESNLALLERAGPTAPAFNEFNPLFERNRLALQLAGNVGTRDLLGDEVVLSGVWNKVSFSVGQFHVDTNGFRENNDQNRNILNAFIQISLSHRTSIQSEYRKSDVDKGDLALRLDPEAYSANVRQSERLDSGRVGIHHALTPRSHVIGSFLFEHTESGLSDRPGGGTLQINQKEPSFLGEVQYLYRARRVQLNSGFGRFSGTRERHTDLELHLPFPPFTIQRSDSEDADIRHTNLYSYATFDYRNAFTFTLGGSADFFKRTVDIEANQFNPKAGVIWAPNGSTTVRAAVFRTLQRSLISNQTIERTQVAGFNQFFDGPVGEDAWRSGVAVDQRISRRLHAGAELSRRALDVPVLSLLLNQVTQNAWKEYFGRAYLYSAPHPSLALTADYLFERFDREGFTGVEQIFELKTHRLPAAVAFFHPSGLTARASVTYVNQHGLFDIQPQPVARGDQFAVLDGSISYRLPKRFGLITLDAKNLLNENFNFSDTDPASPSIVPGRLIVLRFVLSL